MTINKRDEYREKLVFELCKLASEMEWLEFKRNNAKPEEIGEYISALANSAALTGQPKAYLIWGVDDNTHNIIGTSFNPTNTKIGNEELESWLLKLLSPKLHFQFHQLMLDSKKVILLEINAAFKHPVQFMNNEYIRIGSYKKRLKDYPEKERELWRTFDSIVFEKEAAKKNIVEDEILKLFSPPYIKFRKMIYALSI